MSKFGPKGVFHVYDWSDHSKTLTLNVMSKKPQQLLNACPLVTKVIKTLFVKIMNSLVTPVAGLRTIFWPLGQPSSLYKSVLYQIHSLLNIKKNVSSYKKNTQQKSWYWQYQVILLPWKISVLQNKHGSKELRGFIWFCFYAYSTVDQLIKIFILVCIAYFSFSYTYI